MQTCNDSLIVLSDATVCPSSDEISSYTDQI
jgi:hypothetical protein